MEAIFEQVAFWVGDKIDVIANYLAILIPIIIGISKGLTILNNIVKGKQLKKYVGLIKDQEEKYDKKLEEQKAEYEKMLLEQKEYFEKLIELNKQEKRKAKQRAYNKIIKGIEEIPQEEEKHDIEPEMSQEQGLTIEDVAEIQKPEEEIVENEEDIIKVDLV